MILHCSIVYIEIAASFTWIMLIKHCAKLLDRERLCGFTSFGNSLPFRRAHGSK